jgi:hypothetical protein
MQKLVVTNKGTFYVDLTPEEVAEVEAWGLEPIPDIPTQEEINDALIDALGGKPSKLEALNPRLEARKGE